MVDMQMSVTSPTLSPGVTGFMEPMQTGWFHVQGMGLGIQPPHLVQSMCAYS